MISLQKYREYLGDYLKKYHNISDLKSFFKCLNPEHEDNHPSMMYTNKYNICKCFACGASYNIFSLIAQDYHLTDFKDQLNKLKELYLGYVPKVEEYEEIDEPLKDYTNYYELCFKNRFKTNYLETRGIHEPLLQKYHIGFDENKKRMIFPIHKNCYFARSVEGKEKYKSKGRSDIWNRKVLENSTEKTIIYVTESIIDALSIEEVAPELKTISINGVGNIMNFAKILNDMNYKGTVIISFDKDNAGITASKNLKEELVKSHIQTFENSLISSFDDGKDLNECLILDREKFQKNVEYFSRAYKEYIEKKEHQKEVSL